MKKKNSFQLIPVQRKVDRWAQNQHLDWSIAPIGHNTAETFHEKIGV
jgi:hypothetical protein